MRLNTHISHKCRVAILALFIACTSIQAQESINSNDYAIQFEKSFIWAFTKYIEFPLESEGEHFVIAVYDYPEIIPALNDLVSSYGSVKGRPLVIRELKAPLDKAKNDLNSIEMAVTKGSGNDAQLFKLLNTKKPGNSQEKGTLIICSDCKDFSMVRFYEPEKGKVMFELDQEKIESRNIIVGKVLMELANETEFD
jgi:hypothetical protein